MNNDKVISNRKRQNEKADLEIQPAKEKMQAPTLTYDRIKSFFDRFTYGDLNDINYRRALVDTFINRIYLFDFDVKVTIYYNAHEAQNNVPPKRTQRFA